MKLPAILALVLLAACSVQSPAKPQTQPAPPPQATPPPAATATPVSTIESKTAKLAAIDGFLPLYWDAENGKLLMRITRLGEELIYQTSLPAGVGSNPIGLHRAGLGETLIVRFARLRPQGLIEGPHSRPPALSND